MPFSFASRLRYSRLGGVVRRAVVAHILGALEDAVGQRRQEVAGRQQAGHRTQDKPRAACRRQRGTDSDFSGSDRRHDVFQWSVGDLEVQELITLTSL